jgi:TolB protein
MPRFLCLFLSLALSAPAFAQVRDIGRIDVVVDSKTIPVRVSGDTPELNSLALEAFGSHGRYRLVAYGYTYDIRFSEAGPGQVRVDVTRGIGDSVASEVVSGATERQALFRAADVAVERTNGLGLKGFFDSRLVCVGLRTGHKELYVGDLYFGGVRQVTNDRSDLMTPRWSPDGTRILYTSFYHSGFPDIFLIDLATYQRTTFASFRGTNSGAHFSPDGQRVAMVLSGEGNPEIYVSNAQGRMISRRTRYDSVKSSPCWSPDGTRIVFASQPGPQLYVISAAGGPMRRITYDISSYCAEPDWSRAAPDKIAFTIRVGSRYQIAVYDFSTGQSTQVSHAPFDGVEPCWLEDGRHLVYTARDAYRSRICILDTETGKSTPVSPASFGQTLQANAWPQR